MRFATVHRLVAIASCITTMSTLAGCAFYHREPLVGSDTEKLLASPDRNALAQGAGHLHHPLIAPVTLDFSRPLTSDEVTVIAVLANPDLRALRMKEGVAAAQVFASGLFPDPQISGGVDQLLSPKDQGLVNGYSGSVGLDLLGALATRAVERKIARSAQNQARLDIAWQEWTTAGQARVLAIRLPYQTEAASLAKQAADSANRILILTLEATQRGDLKGEDLEARRIAAADATVRAAATARDAETSRLELNRLLGLRPEEALDLVGPAPLATWITPDAAALFESARAQRLDLQALAAAYDGQEATLHRAILGQYPRLGITLARARDTSAVHTLSPAVNFDLPLWNRNAGVIDLVRADRSRLRAEYAARLHQTRAEIAALVAGINRDEAARSAVAAGMADVTRIADSFDESAKRGDVTLPVADSARAAAIDKQIQLLGLEQSCAEQRIALALATGTAFP